MNIVKQQDICRQTDNSRGKKKDWIEVEARASYLRPPFSIRWKNKYFSLYSFTNHTYMFKQKSLKKK